MSNQVALFAGGALPAIPEHLRGIEVDEQTKALAGGGGGLRISIKGGVFRMLNDGEEIARNDDRAMNVVIVRSSPDNARQYYEGEYVDGEATAPTCWSSNGVTPEAEVKNKQAASCATCPQNVAGSGNGDSRACRFKRDLAVVLDGDLDGKVFKLSLPATSLFGKPENNVMPLQAYGKLLVQHNLPVNAVVTEMRFDTSVTQPKLGFKAARYLSKDEYELVKQQGETPEAIAATKTTAFQQDSGKSALDIPGAPAEGAAVTAKTSVAAPAPAVVATPAVTEAAAPAPKRARSKPAAAPAAAPAPATTNVQSPEPPSAPTGPVMTAKAEFTYEEYISAKWTDEQLIAEGLMEAPKKAAPPPAPAAKKPAPPPAPAAEPVVVEKAPAAAPAPAGSVAAQLAAWDSDE